MTNISDCLVVAYDLSEGDEAVLTVGRVSTEESGTRTLTLNKLFRGKEAEDLYNVLTSK